MIQWRYDMENAPRDGRILAIDAVRGYVAVVVYAAHEWECVDFSGEPMGIGFYPTAWASINAPEGEG